MNKMFTGVGLAVVLGVIAVVFFRSATPQEVVAPTPETTFVENPSDSAVFIQEAPVVGSPDEEVVNASATPTASATQIVTIEDTQFVPSEIVVSVGTTVKFVNNGQGLHWVASDVHPTHEALPGFDAGRGLATGESYEYTFSEVGTWSFHDHLRPSLVGSVVVE